MAPSGTLPLPLNPKALLVSLAVKVPLLVLDVFLPADPSASDLTPLIGTYTERIAKARASEVSR